MSDFSRDDDYDMDAHVTAVAFAAWVDEQRYQQFCEEQMCEQAQEDYYADYFAPGGDGYEAGCG